jgi:hypothetical protein
MSFQWLIRKIIVSLSETFSDSKGKRVRHYIELWQSAGTRYSVHLLRIVLLNRWCILRDAVCSLHGHIQTQFATGRAGVDLGPAWERDSSGILCPCIRTVARRLYIEKLEAIHPWADGLDLQMFLAGFDAGEQYLSRIHGISEHTHSCEQRSSWVLPSILNPLQDMRATGGHTSDVIPEPLQALLAMTDARGRNYSVQSAKRKRPSNAAASSKRRS